MVSAALVVVLACGLALSQPAAGACGIRQTGETAAATPEADPQPEPSPEPAPAPIFRFETDGLWLNLHHSLYVLGRAEAGLPDAGRRAVVGAPQEAERGLAGLSPEDKALWREAVGIYVAGASRLDAVFDEELVTATRALVGAESLDGAGLDPAWAAALERAAPLYSRVWWPEHLSANRAWVEAMEPLVAEHGAAVLAFLTRAYGRSWLEDGYPVQVSGYSNWAGAYSTEGRLLVVSSLDDETRGTLAGLESVFHEAAHQWDEAVLDELIAAAKAEGVRFDAGLSHALLFFTAGEAVRSVAPDYVPYARAYGVWDRGSGVFLPAIEAGWQPYLRGPDLGREEARAAALRAVMRALDKPAAE
jgi:hypothetical protein